MALFIFTLVLMFALFAVLYLMVRALPRVAEEPAGEQKNFLDRWAHSEIPEKIDNVLNGFLAKFLRKTKVFTLKLDNALSKHIERIKTDDNEKKAAIDFKEIAEQNKEGQ